MIRLAAPDFDEAWKAINLSFLMDEVGVRDARSGQRSISFFNEISLSGSAMTLDMGAVVGYSDRKWSGLLASYVDQESLQWFVDQVGRKAVGKSKIWSVPFAFKQKKKSNGSCLIGFSVTHPNDKVLVFHFYSRVAEVTRRMLVDFILFHKIVEEVNKNLQYPVKVNFTCPMFYQSGMVAPVLANHFDFPKLGFTIDERKLSGYRGIVEYSWNRYRNGEVRQFAQAQRIMKIVRGDKAGKTRVLVPIERLSVWTDK